MIEGNEFAERYGSRPNVDHPSLTVRPGGITTSALAAMTLTDAVADRSTRGSE